MSLLISGTSSKAPATQTASSEAARIASSSAISVVPTRSLEGRVFLALRAMARCALRPAYRLLSSLGVPFATSAVSATLCDNMRGSSSNCSPIGNPTRLFLDSGGVPACSLTTTRECHTTVDCGVPFSPSPHSPQPLAQDKRDDHALGASMYVAGAKAGPTVAGMPEQDGATDCRSSLPILR